MVYLASPYTNVDPRVVNDRYLKTKKAMAILLGSEIMVYSPIVHCHEVAKRHQLPTDYLFWLNYNTHFMDLSSSCIVLCLGGWRESKGVKHEISWFEGHRRPILYKDENCNTLNINGKS
jgi:hypothetical protein